MGGYDTGSPYTPHAPAETEAMLEAVGVDRIADLFDIPDAVRFDGSLDIEAHTEQAIRTNLAETLAENDDLVEFLGRGHYDHYVPSLVDHLADRQEFLTSYTQYQPEIAQGFLQALFEYQSILVELTGLEIANCSLYDAASALGEAATLAARVRSVDGDTILVPDHLQSGKRAVLENYATGAGLTVLAYAMDDGAVDIADLETLIDDDVAMVYAESPTVRGVIEPALADCAALAHDHGGLFCLGSDPLALAILESPADVGADIVIGDAATLGLPASYGMGMGLFATREQYLRQVPGRLVGVSEDASGRRAYTLTLQTREQHIRRERATSNICTNQAWVALRTAIHVASLGPKGLVNLASDCVSRTADVANRMDDIHGMSAPVHDRHHFREFLAACEKRPAEALAADLQEAGIGVHALDDQYIQVCVTETNEHAIADLLATIAEVSQ